MHSLIFKRLESPKKMEKVKDLDKQDCSVEAELLLLDAQHNLFRSSADEYCQPCNLPSLSVNLPHSSTCSYGIQALLHNVHRGYAITDGDEHTSDHDHQMISSSITHDRDDSSPRHESDILRQWKQKKEEELEERKRESHAKLNQRKKHRHSKNREDYVIEVVEPPSAKILEQATAEREKFYKEREAQIEAKKQLNREREAKYHAKVEAKQHEQLAGGNLWEAVAALVDLHGGGDFGKSSNSAGSTSNKHSLSPKSVVDHQLSTPKKQDNSSKSRQRDYLPKATKKSIDLSRMKEILLKLQHQPVVH